MMTGIKRWRLSLGLVIGVIFMSTPLFAQAQPGFDLAEALAAAQPGATIIVPPGVYNGPFLIDKPVILEGKGKAIIDGGGQGDVITVHAPDVTIRGFVVRNSGISLDREHAGITGLAPRLTLEANQLEDVLFGIYLKNAPDSVIRNNIVHSKDLDMGRRGDGLRLWYSANSLLEGNHVVGSRDMIIWFSPHTIVRRNIVEESRYGLHFMSTDDQLVEENILRNNSVGIYVMYGARITIRQNLLYNNRGPSGYGLGLKDVDNFIAEGNRIVSNRVGLYIDNAPRASAVTVLIDHNLLAYNEIGITLLPLVVHSRYTENIFQENSEQIAISGGGTLRQNAWSQAGRGNYWSDYAGFDADGDQVGDLPYRSVSLYENLLEKYPELRLFKQSPATNALDLAAKAFPIFQPKPKLTDEHPLMLPPQLPPPLPTALLTLPGVSQTPVAANGWVPFGMIGVASAILFLGMKRRMPSSAIPPK